MKIGRTLFWFKDGEATLRDLTSDFFGLSTLLNSLLNEFYKGKKIKFFNVTFSNSRAYKLFPNRLKNEAYYANGHLSYYAVFDSDVFIAMNTLDQKRFLWDEAYKGLQASATLMKNPELSDACEIAYHKGIKMNLNTDHTVLEEAIELFGQKLKAAVIIQFKEDKMYSKFLLEDDKKILYEQDIDTAQKNMEVFLEIYKKMEQENDTIIIKGAKHIEYLPLTIKLDKSILN